MAKNKVKIDVTVDDKGTTKKVGVGAKNAADNLDKAGKSAHNTDRQLKGAAQASSNTTKNFSKMSQGISGGLVPAYATLAAQLFAVSAAFNFLKRSGDIVTLQRGQEAFAATTGTAMRSLAKDIIAATEAQIGFQEASQAAAIGIASGLSPEQLTRLGTAAKQTAAILGRDVTDAFNRLVRGTTKAEPELLDELGIILRLDKATSDYALALGKNKNELSAFERTQAVTNDVLAQAEEKFGAIEQVVGITVNPFNQLGKAFDDIIIKVQEIAAALAGPLAKVLTDFPLLVGGAFAFFMKGILVSALPNLAAFGDSMRAVAKEGSANFAALQGQILATNRALTAARADPAAARALGSAATAELQGSLASAGLAGMHGFKGASSGKQLTNKQVANLRTRLKKAFNDIEGFSEDAFNKINSNLDDIVLSNDGAAKKMTSSQMGFFAKVNVGYLKMKAQGLSTFAVLTVGAAKLGAALITAFNIIGIAAFVFSLGAMAVNFIKGKKDGDKLTSTLDIQAKKMELLKDKIKSATEEFKNFNAIQEILGRDRGTDASLALGKRLSTYSEADVKLGLGDIRTKGIGDFEKDLAEYNKLNTRIDEIFAEQEAVQAGKRQTKLGTTKFTSFAYGTGAKSSTTTLTSEKALKILGTQAQQVVDAQAELSDANAGFMRFQAAQEDGGLMKELIDEREGFTLAMRKSSVAVDEYVTMLDKQLKSNQVMNASQIAALALARKKAAADLIAIGQTKRLNKEADKQIDAVKRQLAPQNKYATSITATNNAIKNMTDAQGNALATLSGPEKKKLARYREEIKLLEHLAALEDKRAQRAANLAFSNAEMQQVGRGSRAGQNLFASGRKESARRANLASAQNQRTVLEEDRRGSFMLLNTELARGAAGDKQKIADARKQIKLKEKQIELQDISIQKLKDEGNMMREFGIQTADALEGALGNAFLSLIDGSKSASEAMKDFAKSVLQSMAQIAANQIAAQILTGIGGFFTGGGGGATIQMSQPTMVARRGGLFENAPGYRYGTDKIGMYSEGGVAKGRQAGYPAVLHGTEAVVPLPNGNKIPVELKGGGGDQNNIVINISSEGNVSTGQQTGNDAAAQKEVGKLIAATVQKELVKQKRPGGLLSPYGAR